MSEEIALAAADLATVEAMRRQLATAEAYIAYWQQAHADVCVQIGRLDYALEEIERADGIRDARHWARKMRAEIAARGKAGRA